MHSEVLGAGSVRFWVRSCAVLTALLLGVVPSQHHRCASRASGPSTPATRAPSVVIVHTPHRPASCPRTCSACAGVTVAGRAVHREPLEGGRTPDVHAARGREEHEGHECRPRTRGSRAGHGAQARGHSLHPLHAPYGAAGGRSAKPNTPTPDCASATCTPDRRGAAARPEAATRGHEDPAQGNGDALVRGLHTPHPLRAPHGAPGQTPPTRPQGPGRSETRVGGTAAAHPAQMRVWRSPKA